MKSTGEVMGINSYLPRHYTKPSPRDLASPRKVGQYLVTIADKDKKALPLIQAFRDGFKIYAAGPALF